jgi:hypothetical protein
MALIHWSEQPQLLLDECCADYLDIPVQAEPALIKSVVNGARII